MQLGINDLTQNENQEIQRLLAFSQHSPMELSDLWRMMDIVWDEIGCDSSNLEPEKISAYAHTLDFEWEKLCLSK